MPPLHLLGAAKIICKAAALAPIVIAINILPVMAAQKYGALDERDLEGGIKDHQGRHQH